MTGNQKENTDLYRQLAPWVVLATSVLITACRTGRFTAIDLLKAPVRYSGKVENGVAQALVPKGFPLPEAILISHRGTLFSKVKELPFAKKTENANEKVDVVGFDIKSTALATNGESFDIVYYPFYRFLSENYFFDADNKVAAYIADCVRFMLLRDGGHPTVRVSGETCSVNSGSGIQIDMTGMTSLSKVEIHEHDAHTSFDLDRRRIAIDQRMFPDAYYAGKKVLEMKGKLQDVSISCSEFCLTLEYAKGAPNV
jgi:hypothetical protein